MTRSAAPPPSARSTRARAWRTLRSGSPSTGRVWATIRRRRSAPVRLRIGRQSPAKRGPLEGVMHRALQLGKPALEEMPRPFDEREALGLHPGGIGAFELGQRTELVGRALDDGLGLGRAREKGE